MTDRRLGERLKRKEVKTEIITYILSNNAAFVSGPSIIEYIRQKCSIVDEKNIRKHLRELREQHCIEKIPVKSGLENKWKIEKIENLRNIRRNYPNVKLNKYEKSLLIVLQETGKDIKTVDGIIFYVNLLISTSFFNAFIDTDIKLLYKKARDIYQYLNPLETQHIKNRLLSDYNAYITRNPYVEISYETFEDWMIDMSERKDIYPSSFKKLREFEFSMSTGLSYHTHPETTEYDLQLYSEISYAGFELRVYNTTFELSCLNLLFEHYFCQDILNGIVYENEEKEFAIKTKCNELEERGPIDDDFDAHFNRRLLKDLEQISVVLAKHKHPSIFGDIYRTPIDTYNGLLEIFNKNKIYPEVVFR